jgi:hypothetical protein
LYVSFKVDDHGSCRGNTAQALDQWRHPVASSEALDVLHRAMCPVSYHHIRMAIELASNCLHFSSWLISLLFTTLANNYVMVNIKEI